MLGKVSFLSFSPLSVFRRSYASVRSEYRNPTEVPTVPSPLNCNNDYNTSRPSFYCCCPVMVLLRSHSCLASYPCLPLSSPHSPSRRLPTLPRNSGPFFLWSLSVFCYPSRPPLLSYSIPPYTARHPWRRYIPRVERFGNINTDRRYSRRVGRRSGTPPLLSYGSALPPYGRSVKPSMASLGRY